MEMPEFKSNSYKSKKEQSESTDDRAKPAKVVTGLVKTKKKSEVSKFADVFIAEDVSNVKNYILMDVLVPAVKKAISDIVRNGIDMILYGDSARNSGNRSAASKVSYNRYYDEPRYTRPASKVGYSYDDIILESRGEAEEVLARMDEIIDTYKMVRVADLYDLVGITGNFTDNKYGWTNIRNAEVVRVRDGYMIKLPKPLPIE